MPRAFSAATTAGGGPAAATAAGVGSWRTATAPGIPGAGRLIGEKMHCAKHGCSRSWLCIQLRNFVALAAELNFATPVVIVVPIGPPWLRSSPAAPSNPELVTSLTACDGWVRSGR